MTLQTTPGRSIALYDDPEIHRFGKTQADELSQFLKELDNTTTVDPLNYEGEFQLDEEGKTKRGGYRFTSYAFKQVSQIIAPGLSKLLPSIAGTDTLPISCEFLVDSGLSLYFWNRVVDLRFPLFRSHRVIRNTKNRRIEGLIGHSHQYLDNRALYQTAQEVTRDLRPQVGFYSAMLVGRRLALWYRSREPLFTLNLDGQSCSFYDGYYFTNGESTGTSVRGTLAIFTPWGLCLGPYKPYGERVTHTGKEFPRRMAAMFYNVLGNDIPRESLQDGISQISSTSLGFCPTMTREERKTHTRKLVRALNPIGVSKNLATEVVASGLAKSGAERLRSARPSLQDASRLYSQRTLLDLFAALVKFARATDLSRREKLEQAAFELLTGQVQIPRSERPHGTTSRAQTQRANGR